MSRARARSDGRERCGKPRASDGRRCARLAGSGTDHPGYGPCADHDDGSFEKPLFAENLPARAAFLAAVRASTSAAVRGEHGGRGIRELVEPLGYHRRDVVALTQADAEFAEDYIEARGIDPDTIRNAIARGVHAGSERMVEWASKLYLPEARELQRLRLDGRLDVQAVPYVELANLRADSIRDELRACNSERELFVALMRIVQPAPVDLPAGGRAALELVEGEATRL